MVAYAHSRNAHGQRHELSRHLIDVAERARANADKFGAGELAYWAGIWHDIGKFHPDFQRYLLDCETARGAKRRGPDHKRAGAAVAAKNIPPLSLLVQGHHGGLQSLGQLRAWIDEGASRGAVEQAVALARAEIGDKMEPQATPSYPSWANDPIEAEFLLRMLFSALVDADCLDTESHFDPDQAVERSGTLAVPDLWNHFHVNQSALLVTAAEGRVNRVRREVYEACVDAGSQPPGFFRLTVPTGGGKTRSSLGFGLRHALIHGLDRVIVAIPYTSIIEQTAETYRGIFQDSRAVLEHHSAVAFAEAPDSNPVTADEAWTRLASENWDAPIVVTTNVQLFESLLGQRTGACRKLHNIARSVIILDEVQTLPTTLLDPLLSVLRSLVAHYQVSVVLCTATQPALDDTPGFRGLPNLRDIISNPSRHFATLERVTYEWPCLEGNWSWDQVADELRRAPAGQGMAVVNTKADALALLDALDDPNALHLSTLLCGAHRRTVIGKIRCRLSAGEPCLLVATQVVEAGVDLDFPIVLRALGPLDRIVQAAGRCNREGRLPSGRVVIFAAEKGGVPPGPYRTGTDTTSVILHGSDGCLDLHDPATFLSYFRRFYRGVDLDKEEVQKLRRAFDYQEVARRARLIKDDDVAVAVRYRSAEGDVDALLEAIRNFPQRSRAILRKLQPFIVSVRRHPLDRYAAEGLTAEITPGLWQWFGDYDDVRGLGAGQLNPARLVVFE